MDNIKYIDLKSYEILDSPQGYIYCDKDIVDIILILNKKGYKTCSSCAGHNELSYCVDGFYIDCSELDEFKGNPNYRVFDALDNKYYVYGEIVGSSTYISFEDKYNFNNIPDGYIYMKMMGF